MHNFAIHMRKLDKEWPVLLSVLFDADGGQRKSQEGALARPLDLHAMGICIILESPLIMNRTNLIITRLTRFHFHLDNFVFSYFNVIHIDINISGILKLNLHSTRADENRWYEMRML